MRAVAAILLAILLAVPSFGQMVGQTRDATDIEIAAGAGVVTSVYKFGENLDVDTAADEDVWDGGGDYGGFLTAWDSLSVVSSSDVDSAGNAGALTVVVLGLDSLKAFQADTLSMDGTNAVQSAKAWFGTYRAYVATSGDSLRNIGDLTFTALGASAVTSKITADRGQTRQLTFTVPTNTTAFLTSFFGNLRKSTPSGTLVDLNIHIQDGGTGSWRQIGTYPANVYIPFEQYIVVPAESNIKVRAGATNNNSDVSAFLSMLLEAG